MFSRNLSVPDHVRSFCLLYLRGHLLSDEKQLFPLPNFDLPNPIADAYRIVTENVP
jgi:hypothetical protein